MEVGEGEGEEWSNDQRLVDCTEREKGGGDLNKLDFN